VGVGVSVGVGEGSPGDEYADATEAKNTTSREHVRRQRSRKVPSDMLNALNENEEGIGRGLTPRKV
jgi:hypothetical protein